MREGQISRRVLPNRQRRRRANQQQGEEAVHDDNDDLVAGQQTHDGAAVLFALLSKISLNARAGAKDAD